MKFLRKTELYRLCNLGEEGQRAAVQAAVGIDDTLGEGQWEAIDGLLNGLELEKLTPTVVVALLSITWPAKEHLKERERFVAQAEVYLTQELGLERAQNLLKNRR